MTVGPTFKLTLDLAGSSGESFDLTGPTHRVGRDPANDIVIEAQGVSRRHAQFDRQGDGYVVHDLGSSNGTFVNGKRIVAPHVLAAGDTLRLGQSVQMRYEAVMPPAPQPTIVAAPMAAEEALPPAPAEATRRADRQPPAPPRESPRVPENWTGGPAEDGPPAMTVVGEFVEPSVAMVVPAELPQLTVEEAGGASRTFTLVEDHYSLGRADDNAIVVTSKIVSRHHARLDRVEGGGYQLVVLPDAGNPVLFEGRPLDGPRRLRHDDKLRIGGRDPGLMVTLTYRSPSEAVTASRFTPITFGEKTRIQIGRDPGNDVVLNVPQVSRFHALVERVGQRFRVTDLRSSNGTFVNDRRIQAETWLKPDDTIRIGPHRFVMGRDRLAQVDETAGLRVDAVGLNKWVRKDLNILQDISLTFQPREFVVVVRQSGGGKSTLVDAIAGYRPATHGRVLVNGTDVYHNFDAIRNDIGFVPQRDIIHTELTVYQALDFAAQLRMPADTTAEERRARVMEVLDDLDLTHRKDVQISGLSGGQQKRVSIGVELLTKPGLFFLDEPTSGLDPGTETALMQLMRRLADQGRTIILITHATKNVMLADKVIFLARGGYLAWFGPPDEALKYFDGYRSERDRRAYEMEFDQIYAILDDPAHGSPADWAGSTSNGQPRPGWMRR